MAKYLPANALNPIEEKLTNLSETLVNLATKDDICSLIKNVEQKIAEERFERDHKILELEEKLDRLMDQRYDDLEFAKRLSEKVVELENSLANSQAKFDDKIREFQQNEYDSDSDVDDNHGNTVKEPLDMLVISDSICRHLDVNLVNPGGKNKLICRPGAKIEEIRNALINFEAHYDINKLVVHVMTNHIPDEAPADIAREMLDFIKDIKTNMPKTKLFISLALPKINASWLEGINCLNSQIFDARHRCGFHVIQHPYFAERGYINEALLAGDKIHLSRLGVKQLGVDIKHCLMNH